MSKALVTGATAGIGESFTRLLASNGHDLILVARDVNRLQERAQSLRDQYKVTVEVLQADLANATELARVEARLAQGDVDVLINNAGFGINKSFLVSDINAEQQLLDVLVTAPMRLMHAVLPVMKAKNAGTIINISSVAGWIAGGTYSAAKSYLTVLTESLHTELSATKINVHALAPGFTRTEFHQRGRMKMTGLPNFMWLDADRVVAAAWKSSQKGQAISVPGWQYKILSTISRFGPRPLVRNIGMNVRKKQRQPE
jgi:short-subunit dehydrogenase